MKPEMYRAYKAADFAQDESFFRWVVQNETPGKAEKDGFWASFWLCHPEKQEDMATAREIILAAREQQTRVWMSQQEHEALTHRILSRVGESEGKGTLPGWWLPFRPSLVAAAVAVLLMLGVGLGWWALRSQEQVYATTYGQTRTLALPDGSKVQLNANSRLRVKGSWEGHADREVWLEGEAYFEVVKKRSDVTFLVHTQGVVVKVLGTRFNVNSRAARTQVVLNEGQITLYLNRKVPQHDEAPIVMVPGDMVAYTHEDEQLVQRRVNAAVHSSWKEGIQQFEKAPLREILKKMEEIYGVTIEWRGEATLLDRNITMGIPVEDLAIALATVEGVLGLHLEQVGDQAYSFKNP